jgi:alkylation response protein AidB-like acyl-CoA dehydrogenase
MNFSLTEEQRLLTDSIARFLAERYNFEERRRLLARSSGFDASAWQAFATSLGLLGATLPEDVGGPVETMLIMEALGRALVVEPYLETVVIGGGLLKRVPGERALELLSRIVLGQARLAFAAAEVGARYVLHDVSTTARREGDGWVIEGRKPVVAAAPTATHLLVTARTSAGRRDAQGVSLFLVERDTPGLTTRSYRLIDDRPAADLVFEGVRVDSDALLGGLDAAMPLIELVVDEATAALCSEAVGGMRQMLHDTVEYTKQRRQFGQPLASFQVLQHRMVDMYMALEQAVSAVYLATLQLDADATTRRKAVSAAKVTIGRSARMIGQNAVQLHGGMGMTDELAIGHYFKRATVIEHEFGNVDFHLARYAAADAAQAA